MFAGFKRVGLEKTSVPQPLHPDPHLPRCPLVLPASSFVINGQMSADL